MAHSISHLLRLSLLFIAACSGHSDNEVAPWSGPPVDFKGTWLATSISDQGGQVPNASMRLELFDTNASLGRVYPHPSLENKCWTLYSDLTSKSTPDGHGFDGTIQMGLARETDPSVAIHARVEPSGGMHVDIVVKSGRVFRPGETIPDACSNAWVFVATRVKCTFVAGVEHCDPIQ